MAQAINSETNTEARALLRNQNKSADKILSTHLISNIEDMFVYDAAFPKVSQSDCCHPKCCAWPTPDNSFILSYCNVNKHAELKHMVFSVQTVCTESWSFLMYAAMVLIINSFFHNTGSWQPLKSPPQHQTSRGWGTASFPTESQNHTFDPVFLQVVETHFGKLSFRKNITGKFADNSRQLKDTSWRDVRTRGHIKPFHFGLTTPLK